MKKEKSVMDIVARYVHGSEDSTDLDVLYIADRIPETKECPMFCNEDPHENRNIAVIEDGIIAWSFKGFADEVNNAVLNTYPLHRQDHELLIERCAERDLTVKLLSVLRKSVMELRHTTLRRSARTALRTGYDARLRILQEADLRQLDWTITEAEQIERRKTLAFQFGQAIALDEGIELFTKTDIAEHFPSLRPYLYREACRMDELEDMKQRFLDVTLAVKQCKNKKTDISGRHKPTKIFVVVNHLVSGGDPIVAVVKAVDYQFNGTGDTTLFGNFGKANIQKLSYIAFYKRCTFKCGGEDCRPRALCNTVVNRSVSISKSYHLIGASGTD
jgi:hypothetical protein